MEKTTKKAAAVRLLEKDNILIISHRSPDGDTLGSGLALFYALKSLGKNAKLICEDELPKRYEYLYGARSFEAEMEEEYIVAVDLADIPLLGKNNAEIYADKVDLCIDHHKSNSFYAKETCLEVCSSTCELMYEIIKLMEVELNKEIANCLYTGIITDTGGFMYSNTESSTHIAAAELIEAGADFLDINLKLFGTKSKERMAAEEELLKNLRYSAEGQVAAMNLGFEFLKNLGESDSELDGISSIPISIEGVDIGLCIREREKGEFRISIRTSFAVDASILAAKLGGGGHERAAGCMLLGNIEEVLAKLFKLCDEALLEKGKV